MKKGKIDLSIKSKDEGKHNLNDVLAFLSKRKGVKVTGNVIEVDKNRNDLGNKSWGRIDYLCNKHRYVWIHKTK